MGYQTQWPKIKNTINIATMANINKWIWPKIIVFGQVEQVNVRPCHFSVMLKQLGFVGFGHIQTDFWSNWFGKVN